MHQILDISSLEADKYHLSRMTQVEMLSLLEPIIHTLRRLLPVLSVYATPFDYASQHFHLEYVEFLNEILRHR